MGACCQCACAGSVPVPVFRWCAEDFRILFRNYLSQLSEHSLPNVSVIALSCSHCAVRFDVAQ